MEINLERGDLSELSRLNGRGRTVTAPPFGHGIGNNLPLDGHLDSNNPNAGLAPTNFAVEGTESDGSTAKADVCTVDNDRSSPTFGRVSAGSGAAAGDKCSVTVTMGAVGYAPVVTAPVVLTIASGELEFGNTHNPTTPTLAFQGSLESGDSDGFLYGRGPSGFCQQCCAGGGLYSRHKYGSGERDRNGSVSGQPCHSQRTHPRYGLCKW